MFLGLAVFIILAIAAAILVIRTIKALFRRLTGHKEGHGHNALKEDGKKKSEQEDRAEKESEEKSQQETKDRAEDPEEEFVHQRHEWALADGITEDFSTNDTSMEVEPKAIEERCTEVGGLTCLEFENRDLAGKDFFGFNLIIEKDSRMVLTYNGQAVASITKVEVKSTAIINGQETEGTAPAWRVNTFPPSLRPGMVISDLDKMLSASDRIKACRQNPSRIVDMMISEFSSPENTVRLKCAIGPKIQEKEAGSKKAVQQKRAKGPVKPT